MVEVFKTNVQGVDESKMIIQQLLAHLPDSKINFDLDDCDYILRVESLCTATESIISTVQSMGYQCVELVD
ncbi:MAG: hypothetical protein V4538_11770 [Bacteroidota bacterium]